MPTQNQIDVIREQLRQKKIQQDRQKTAGAKSVENEALPTIEKQESVNPNTGTGGKYIDVDTALAPARKRAELGTEGIAKKYAQAADDAARVAAGPVGNLLEGAMTSGTVEDAAAATADARSRLAASGGEGLATGIEAAGQVGQALALPGAMLATPARAAITSGGMGMFDTFAHKLERGEPINEGVEEILNSGMSSAVSGLAGYHIGKAMGNVIAKFAGNDTSITALAQRAAKENEDLRNAGAKAMDDSRVMIKRQALASMLRGLEKKMNDFELSPRTAREGWRAMNILRDRVNKLTDIDLRNFNELRKITRDSLYSPTGALKNSVNNNDLKIVEEITKTMKGFVSELPKHPAYVRSGDIAKGVKGWETMNLYHQKMARTERVAELIANAEAKTATGGKSFEQALQDEFGSLFNTKAGRELANREFNTSQRQALRKIAEGDLSQKVFERLDRLVGSTIIAPAFRAVQSTHGTLLQAEESRNLARKAISAVSETGITRPVGSRVGAAAGGVAGRENQ